jgi:hypothetical protein
MLPNMMLDDRTTANASSAVMFGEAGPSRDCSRRDDRHCGRLRGLGVGLKRRTVPELTERYRLNEVIENLAEDGQLIG